MYKNFYFLTEEPFKLTPDPDFFFLSKNHKEAFYQLLYGIRQKKGIITITGEIGTGKTTLCRTLLNNLDEKTKTAFIFNPSFSELELLEAVLQDFGLKPTNNIKLDFINQLNKFLIKQAMYGGNAVIIIDEAQNLNIEQLERIRLLSNLETEKDKLLQIVLVGQPELRKKLNDKNLRQLRQRISVHYHILPLAKDEVINYINHRLNIAGADGNIKFDDSAFEIIFNFSKGTPRLINILCDRALLAGFAYSTNQITPEIINNCIGELKL